MSEKLIVNVSPHIRSKKTTTSIMLDVIIALMPALIAGIVVFGVRALLLTLISVLACVGFEAGYEALLKKPITIMDLSAVVTGLLIALNVPANLPLWIIVVGDLFAIVVAKMLFGGLGRNFMNPALVGRVVMMFSFASFMGSAAFAELSVQVPTLDAMTSATPLGDPANSLVFGNALTFALGNYKGVIGETSAIALFVGGIYLMIRKVIKPTIPFVYIGATFLFELLFGFGFEASVMSLLTGGLFLGAFFMATDYVTSPTTRWGKVIFGVVLGLITALIRVHGSLAEGVTFAIIFGNILVPFINDLTMPVPYGVKERRALDKAEEAKRKEEEALKKAEEKAIKDAEAAVRKNEEKEGDVK